MPTIVPIVEGPGDVAAFPPLLVKILQQVNCRSDVIVAHGKGSVVNAQNKQKLEKHLEKFLRHAQNKPDCGAIIVLVDADDDCPVIRFEQMTHRCCQAGLQVPVQVVYAHRMYESWFLASIETIRGRHGISEEASLEVAVETVGSPKKWLSDRMPHGSTYKETTHQVSLSKEIDLDMACEKSRSFRRLCHALEQLVAEIDLAST